MTRLIAKAWRWQVALLLLLVGCAQQASWVAARDGSPRAHEGWRYLIAGDAAQADKAFAQALELAPDDPFARFGRAALAFEYGRTELALDDVQALLLDASRPTATPWSRWLATSSSDWVSTLLHESKTWRQRLEFLTDVLEQQLPWPARMELLAVADDAARRAGRLDLVGKVARALGCPTQAQQVGKAGQRPVLDLLADSQVPSGRDGPVLVSGCRAQVPPPDGLPGVLVVRTTITLDKASERTLALDYRGLAAFRVDGGPWHRHGNANTWGPFRSALQTQLAPGQHVIELRLATYGGGAEYWFAAMPAAHDAAIAPTAPSHLPTEFAEPLAAYTQLLVSGMQGEWTAGLIALDQLREARRFALGLVQVGRAAHAEPTRPDNVTRDAARSAWSLAAEQDSRLVRAHLALSELETGEARPREATLHAQTARREAPGWWPAALAVHEALTGEGFEHQADQALDEALKTIAVPESQAAQTAWACPVIDAASRRARQRDQLPLLPLLRRQQLACDARDLNAATQALDAGDAVAAVQGFARAAALSAAPQWLAADQVRALVAAGQVQEAIATTAAHAKVWSRETSFLLRLANLQALASETSKAHDTLVAALNKFPSAPDVRQAARALGVALPIDNDRRDGLEVIAKFMAADRRYDAPAVFVLDRMVERVFADGSRMVLTHNIVRVQSKDALDRWGEVNVPAGAEVLVLRTVKPDLTVREPEDIYGKDSVSAPELEVGDFVEWETLETLEPSAAFGPGFIGQRFYFQSNEAPLEHSEYMVVYPKGMAIAYDPRAAAPAPVEESLGDGLKVMTFVARQVPQIFPERAAVAPLHWLPSVRIASGVSTTMWTNFVADRLSTVARPSPATAAAADKVLAQAGGKTANPHARAAALCTWVTKNIEADGTLDEPATYALSRGRGNRLAVAMALAEHLGLKTEVVLVRPLSTDGVDEPVAIHELMAFSETLLHFPQVRLNGRGEGAFVDLRLRQSPFGYVPPELDGARALRMSDGKPLVARSWVADRRHVDLRIAVTVDGKATLWVKEKLVGGPAVEWTEALVQLGSDLEKRRRRFEEAYLAYHFPGAELQSLTFDVKPDSVQIDYKISIERFAARADGGITVEPRFFLSQPARRFSTEPRRSTTLLMGPDVPLELTAAIEWPAEYRVAEAGEGVVVEPLGPLGPRFVERRTVERSGGDQPARVVIRRNHFVPLLRVPPDKYGALSAALRRVDVAEQAVIRVVAPDKETP